MPKHRSRYCLRISYTPAAMITYVSKQGILSIVITESSGLVHTLCGSTTMSSLDEQISETWQVKMPCLWSASFHSARLSCSVWPCAGKRTCRHNIFPRQCCVPVVILNGSSLWITQCRKNVSGNAAKTLIYYNPLGLNNEVISKLCWLSRWSIHYLTYNKNSPKYRGHNRKANVGLYRKQGFQML